MVCLRLVFSGRLGHLPPPNQCCFPGYRIPVLNSLGGMQVFHLFSLFPPPQISGPHTSYTELMGKLQRERFFYFVRHIGGQPGGLDLSQLAVRAVLDAMGLFSHLPLVPWEPPSLCRFGIKPEFLQNLADRLHGFNYPTRADGNYK